MYHVIMNLVLLLGIYGAVIHLPSFVAYFRYRIYGMGSQLFSRRDLRINGFLFAIGIVLIFVSQLTW